MIAKRSGVEGLEEVAFAPAPKVDQVGSEGFQRHLADSRPALLPALPLQDPNPMLVMEDVVEVN